jgi:hypothetical protein
MPTPLTSERKAAIEAVLNKAAQNVNFREQLLSKPEVALKDSGLSSEDRAMLCNMRRVELEEWGIDVRGARAFLRDNGNKATPVSATTRY